MLLLHSTDWKQHSARGLQWSLFKICACSPVTSRTLLFTFVLSHWRRVTHVFPVNKLPCMSPLWPQTVSRLLCGGHYGDDDTLPFSLCGSASHPSHRPRWAVLVYSVSHRKCRWYAWNITDLCGRVEAFSDDISVIDCDSWLFSGYMKTLKPLHIDPTTAWWLIFFIFYVSLYVKGTICNTDSKRLKWDHTAQNTNRYSKSLSFHELLQ